MLQQWKRDRELCDKEIRGLNAKLRELHGFRNVSTRFQLRLLLNKVACHRQALNQRIIQQETDDEITRLISSMVDMPFTQAAMLQRDMQLNRNASLSPLLL